MKAPQASRAGLKELARPTRNAATKRRSGNVVRSVHTIDSARTPQASSTLHSSKAATAAQTPRGLQDVVKRALKPSSLSSRMLAPAPKAYMKPKNASASRSTPVEQDQANNNVTSTATSHSSSSTSSAVNAAPSAVEKKFNNRSEMILRLIRLNRILSAMSAFTADIAHPARHPFTSAQLESFVLALRTQSKLHSTTRPAPKQTPTGFKNDLWRPPHLDPSIPAKSLAIPVQCMYAMASIYDIALEQDCRPTAKMVSAMLATFAGNLSADEMFRAADLALRQLVPSEGEDQGRELRKISHGALGSFVRTFGRIRKPEMGEGLLRRWAGAQRMPNTPTPASVLEIDGEAVELTGWGNNVVIWHSLITSRVDAGDLPGARMWLERYRAATKQSKTDATAAQPIKPEPYLAYMEGIRKTVSHDDEEFPVKRPQKVASHIRAAMRLMIADHVPVETSVLAFIIDFEAWAGNVDGGASLVDELKGFIEDGAVEDAELLRALLEMRRVAKERESDALSSRSKSAPAALPSTRTLIRSLTRVGEGEVPTSKTNLASIRSRGTLNIALNTAIAERDYPAAIVIFNLFELWRIVPSQTTYSIVLDALVAQGHHHALFAEAGEAVVSISKQNLEATLQSMARDGNGQQAEKIRRVLGSQQNFPEEGIVADAQPAAALRQTQYLIRALNRVCKAEVERAYRHSTKSRLAWLNEKKAPVEELVVTAKDYVEKERMWKEVRGCIIAAQDELLGPKEKREERKTLAGTRLSPLFTSAPALSPRRKFYERPYQKKWAARGFSTSAAPQNDSPTSCELEAAAKGDFSHLDPVRAIYLPGFVPYQLGLALQEHLVRQRADARAALRSLDDSSSTSAASLSGHSSISSSATEANLRRTASQDTLLLLQHRPVYTEGRREESENELVSSHLRSLGADYYLTKRGGQITYHGPGQLVGYPILNLASMNLASRCYVDRIQDSLISLLGERGIETVDPPDNHTGVWADEYHKIASIGIQVRHRISSHGFALNVEQRAMQGFRHITACGIVGRNMTCIHDRLDPAGPFKKYNKMEGGDKDEKVESVARSYMEHFAQVFGRRVRSVEPEEFEFKLEEEAQAEKLRQGLNINVDEEERVITEIKVDGASVTV